MDENVKGKNASKEREARLAAALRDNLRKRKARERGRHRAEIASDAINPPPKPRDAPPQD